MENKIFFWVWKFWLLKVVSKRYTALYQFPFIVFVQFELEQIFLIGGWEVAKEAVRGWVAKTQDAYKYTLEMATREPIEILFTFEDGSQMVRYAPETPITVKFQNGFTATLRDSNFQTIALSVFKRFSNLIEDTSKVLVNGQESSLGYWIRPGDNISLQ